MKVHASTTLALRRKIPPDAVDLVCEFAGGFASDGKLVMYVHGKIAHQIRYTDMLHVDLWKFKEHVEGYTLFDDRYIYEHFSCTYNPRTDELRVGRCEFVRRNAQHHLSHCLFNKPKKLQNLRTIRSIDDLYSLLKSFRFTINDSKSDNIRL